MSYAIIRNIKYKGSNLKGIFRHNERRNKNYSNEDIDKERSYLNYSIKQPKYSYEKEFERIRKEYDLKGQIKTVSNIACEYIITSDKTFFETIGVDETKRYFETAYKFVCEYKDLGEKYILSAKVHMDEQTPHMHLVFLPVVHTKDKKGNEIDKLACSEFWKEKDSYRRLQDAFYEYVISKGFDLERGLPKEETKREHFSIEEYKEITNFEKTKEILDSFNLEVPKVPDIKDFKKIMLNRDEKIVNEIIKPKDELIKDLYDNNVVLYKELSKQRKVVEKAVEYQKERNSLMQDNRELHEQVEEIKKEYENKTVDLEFEYKNQFKKLEKENKRLNKIIDKFQVNVKKFIKWICHKFDMGGEDNLIRDFEKETKNSLEIEKVEKQIKKEDREKEWELEI